MALGMGYDEFWNCHPSRYKAYREMHKFKREMRNQEMWIQGMYVFDAISKALHNQPAFAIHPPKRIDYLDKPLPIFGKSEEEKEAEEQEKLDNFVNYLETFQKRWESKHGRNERQDKN